MFKGIYLLFTVLALVAVAINVVYVVHVVKGGGLRQLFFDTEAHPTPGCDFHGLYQAAAHWRNNGDIYTCDPRPGGMTCCFSYRYLPLGAMAGLPLTTLKPRAAFWLWLAVLELVALLSALVTWRLIGGRAGAVLGALWLTASPVFPELHMGQFNMLQAGLMLGALVSAMRERPAAGVWLAGTMLWKLTGWLALPVLLVKKHWRTLLAAAILGGFSLAVYSVVWKKPLGGFWRNFQTTPPRAEFHHGNFSLMSLLQSIWGAQLPEVVWWAAPGGLLALLLAVTLAARRGQTADLLALWFAAYFFIYPTVWEHHYVMLLPVLAYLYARGRSPLLWLAALLLFLPTPYFWAGPHGAKWAGSWPIIHHAEKLAAALPVLLVALINLWRKR